MLTYPLSFSVPTVGVEPIEVSGVGAGVTTTVVGVELSTPDPNGELPYVGSNVVSIAVGDGCGVGSAHTSI